jgi:UDP-N-acetylmuramyl pentapeptide phosphotransferase/UDP-N-acetylglucosamine-1-phosphate transferase
MRAMPALAPLAAFVVALAVARLLLTPAGRRIALDTPNERSLHERPVPRTGGLALAAGVAAACALDWPGFAVPLVIAAGLALASFADDVSGLPMPLRLAMHLAAAAMFVALALPGTGPVAFVVFVLALAWAANLYNFMDGADGLAGGMALFGFGAYAAGAALAGLAPLAVLAASIAAAGAGFLVFNWHPARLFMGDAGSVPIGFLAGALGLQGWHADAWPLWFPLLVFAPFVLDATLTLARRFARGERVWQAHREHYYQRLVRMGFGHRGTALAEYAAMAGCAGLALAVFRAPAAVQGIALALAGVAFAGAAVWVDRHGQGAK